MLRGFRPTSNVLIKTALSKVALNSLSTVATSSLSTPLTKLSLSPAQKPKFQLQGFNLNFQRFHQDKACDDQPKKRVRKKRNTKKPIPGVKHIVCVSSGKGGVGKSTVAVNLALAFQECGKKVGILDADINGPSIPKLLDLDNELKLNENETMIIPKEKYGLKCMSMGLLLDDENSAVVWRGILICDTLKELIRKVNWSGLDILVIDCPPGTGDVHITLSQELPVSGAVIVSTPQDVAVADVRKGTSMLKEMKIPILGLIQNMSYFECTKCGEKHYIFGNNDSVNKMCKEMGVVMLGELPLNTTINKDGDTGKPFVYSQPDSTYAKSFKNIAETLIDVLGEPKYYIA
ncbi:P-loop containing nucleoside triphosphate hydrolase protein [Anaeromyces robustus]|jgi:ATP-binding protein involved in chromosome partitioning|uniref:p-loop containing nucleoside triphosphate hydrolase protein n=1 Tax=Anaeromyces robustus TaxID=1754192 RepID=A0A1Y1W234_9FUNG|nr:P-loop containing nucleoside triphosphate hydrolase protein [Anaeromyces robustus]|eukprot:ORX67345.1 P-loop containing nucleoside triphosphate hydrolase protein [Anaeromyces robustus]